MSKSESTDDGGAAANVDELLVRGDAARYLKQQPETLRVWAWKGRGPAYMKVGRRPLYRRSDLDRWLDEQRIDPATRNA